MMLVGLGIDIVDLDRFRRVVETQGRRFLVRCFTEAELEYCESHKDPIPFLAARFAAKEAVSKAFGTGIGKEMSMTEIEVVRLPSGAPEILLHGAAAQTAIERRVGKVLVTLTHSQLSAAAQAVALGEA